MTQDPHPDEPRPGGPHQDDPHHDGPAPAGAPRAAGGSWGRMREPGDPGPAAPGPTPPEAAPGPPSPQMIRARRRAVHGISMALISLGILLAASLSMSGSTLLGALGLLPAMLGAAGFLAVSLGVTASLRLPRQRRRGRGLWLIPGAILLLAVAFLVAAFLTDAASPEAGSPWTIVWLVSAATLVTFAGLGFGLVAAARLTVPDDDDQPLHRVDWAEEYPQRYTEGRERGRPGPDHYDPSWIRGEDDDR